MFRAEVLDPAVDFLADLAGDGAALEFAVGDDRVAIALAARRFGIRHRTIRTDGWPTTQEGQ